VDVDSKILGRAAQRLLLGLSYLTAAMPVIVGRLAMKVTDAVNRNYTSNAQENWACSNLADFQFMHARSARV
jgi:hypothetical protein